MSSSSVSYAVGNGSTVADSNPPSKLKTYGFALVIIVGIGALAVAGVGVAGYFQVGALSHMGQVQAVAMMVTGSSVGIVALVLGSIGLAKSSQRPHAVINSDEHFVPEIPDGRIFGPDLWRCWGIEVVEQAPPPPEFQGLDSNDPFFQEPYRSNYVQIYIPKRVRCNGKEMKFNLNALNELFDWQGVTFSETVLSEIGKRAHPGWILISKKVIPSQDSDLGGDFSLPYALESVVCTLFLNRFYPSQAHFSLFHFTECQETLCKGGPVVAGDLRTAQVGLDLLSNNDLEKRGRTVVFRPS